VSQYQKGETNLDFTEARDSEWQWHQLDHMQVCTLLQTANHASTPPTQFFTGRMRFGAPNQQSQSTEGTWWIFLVEQIEIHKKFWDVEFCGSECGIFCYPNCIQHCSFPNTALPKFLGKSVHKVFEYFRC